VGAARTRHVQRRLNVFRQHTEIMDQVCRIPDNLLIFTMSAFDIPERTGGRPAIGAIQITIQRTAVIRQPGFGQQPVVLTLQQGSPAPRAGWVEITSLSSTEKQRRGGSQLLTAIALFREKNAPRFIAGSSLRGKSPLPAFIDDDICHRCGPVDKSWILVTLYQEQVVTQERTGAGQQATLIADGHGICLEIWAEHIISRLRPLPHPGY